MRAKSVKSCWVSHPTRHLKSVRGCSKFRKLLHLRMNWTQTHLCGGHYVTLSSNTAKQRFIKRAQRCSGSVIFWKSGCKTKISKEFLPWIRELEKWLVDHELRSYYFLNQARLIKQNYFLGRTTYRNDSILAIKAIIKEQLKTYQVEDSVNVQLYQRQIPS